ncbi:hypothetical protein PRB88_gp06 [Klebsiella phage vB_Kpn_ZC2]|uniref:hypothetical protein n=1 Tax=Klebsiella phage vB_Kpn_ZC2 TaxID=2982901 RepID=UPI00233EA055|nr:hypothetical protein PRB88_gp06 [Klebsiella phage vB_Kpn_ZC2]UZN98647.1 hypothetical protein [Klebsiella phage vB_Kpn_ZC2]
MSSSSGCSRSFTFHSEVRVMTKSTITREESVQAVFDLKVGYRLGFADLEILKRVARMALAAMDSSESVELPLDYLQGHKDGLEWASQLAEANHPETGDWLYDDPIELAKAIRKGPDMPPVQPVADSEPVAEITEDLGRLFVKIHYPTTLRAGDKLYRHAQPAPVVPDDVSIFEAAIEECKTCDSIDEHAWNHGVLAVIAKYESCRAAMLAAAPQSPGSDPAPVPGSWMPVSERMPENDVSVLTFDGMYKRVHHAMYGHWQCCEPGKITHWMPLPDAPQEDKP